MGELYRGECLCGAVRWQVAAPLQCMAHCHCTICRKHHGAVFATYVAAPLDGFRYTAGEDQLERYQTSPGWYRPWCRTCGSVAWTALPGQGMVAGPAGNLVDDLPVRPEFHMFVRSKVPWLDINDGLPRHATFLPGMVENAPPDELPVPVDAPEPPARSPGCRGGSCACGRVAYEYSGAPLRMYNCHCSRCRRARSAAHATNLFVPLEGFRYSRGEELVREYRLPEAQRFGVAFCTACGSDVARRSPQINGVVIPAAGLDDDPGMAPQAHIFVGSRANWYAITDPLPQFAELPG
jgi:hypothetical protein